MAATNTTVTTGNKSSGQVTLTAATVDTVTFADTIYAVQVESDGVARITYTTDGTTPTVNGQNGFELPASPSVDVVLTEGSVIKLISSGAASYCVTRKPVSAAR